MAAPPCDVRFFQAWLMYASIAPDPAAAAARLFRFGKVPPGEEVTAGDGRVHLAMLKYMFAAHGLDMDDKALAKATPPAKLMDDPQV
eukprot:1262567-Pyramimonas_sp.AAC.1